MRVPSKPMKDEINDGGPAFPETRWDDGTRQEVQWLGMTLRDYFAGQALTGVVNEGIGSNQQQVIWSYQLADEMIKERNK